MVFFCNSGVETSPYKKHESKLNYLCFTAESFFLQFFSNLQINIGDTYKEYNTTTTEESYEGEDSLLIFFYPSTMCHSEPCNILLDAQCLF